MNKCIRSVVTPLVTPLTGGSASKTPLTSGPASKSQFAVTIDPHKSVIPVGYHWGHKWCYSYHWGHKWCYPNTTYY